MFTNYQTINSTLNIFTAPGSPPSDIRANAEDSETIRVEWKPPPLDKQHGEITYYKLMIVNNSRPDSDASVITISDPNVFEYLITKLKKWTEYRVWMLAGTVIGDGLKSEALFVRTDEDGMYASHVHIKIFKVLQNMMKKIALSI